MGGSKTDAYEREIERVAATHGTLRQDEKSSLDKDADPNGPGIKSTFRDPSTMDGKLRWD